MAAARCGRRRPALVCVVLVAALAARCGDASLHDNFGAQLRPPHRGGGWCAAGERPAFAGARLLSWRPAGDGAAACCLHLRWCPPAPPGLAAALGRRARRGARPRSFRDWGAPGPRTGTALHNVRTGREFVDHYQVLGVGADAEPGEIKRVFRALSRKYHPDVSEGSAEEVYLRITAAYNILSDPDRRASYDQKRLYHIQAGTDGSQMLAANFESELTRQWTASGEGHTCNAFCNCGVSAPNAPLNTNKMQRGGKARADGVPQGAAPSIADDFGDEGRVITPPSTYRELSSFLAQAKRASYSRPSIYTCSTCGGASANRDKCDLCGSMQSGPAQPRRTQDRVFPIYSMHKFGSHLDDDRRHELVHKNHIARSAPSHTRRPMPDDLGMPDVADIDTGAQRIWGQVSPSLEIPDTDAPFGSGRFEADLDFFGVTHDAPSAKGREREPGRKREEEMSAMHLDAISGGCWLFGDMESGVSAGGQLERERAEAIQMSVLQKESEVAALEAKVEQRKRELSELERELMQARGELVRAKAQQGWSGAGAVGMGGAGAVFSTSSSWTAPASQLSEAFSTLSPPGARAPLELGQEHAAEAGGVHMGGAGAVFKYQRREGWSGPGGVDMGGAGAVVKPDIAVPEVAAELSDILSSVPSAPAGEEVIIASTSAVAAPAAGGAASPPVDDMSEQVFSGRFGPRGNGAGNAVEPPSVEPVRQCCVPDAARRGTDSPLDPPKICNVCGCISVGSIRCDCCGSPVAPEQKASEGKHAGLTKVFTMHSQGRTRLSEEVMHTLVHPRHHSEHHAESVEEGALQGRFDVDMNYFGIAPIGNPASAPAGTVQQKPQPLIEEAPEREQAEQGAAAAGPGDEEADTALEQVKGGYYGTLDELNQYLSSQNDGESGLPGRSAQADAGGARVSTSEAAALERETPDVPWQVGGGLEESDDGIGLGAFNRLVAETQEWLGGDEDEGGENDVPSSMWSEEGNDDKVEVDGRDVSAPVDDSLAATATGAARAAEGVLEDKARAVDAARAVSSQADASARTEEEKQAEKQAETEERDESDERRRLEDLAFFVSQMKAYASRLRVEAERAAVLVTEMEGVFVPLQRTPRSGFPPQAAQGVAPDEAPATVEQRGSVDRAAMQPAKSAMKPGTPSAKPKKRRILSVSARRYEETGVAESDVRRQRGSGVVGVYTMHGSPATHLADDERSLSLSLVRARPRFRSLSRVCVCVCVCAQTRAHTMRGSPAMDACLPHPVPASLSLSVVFIPPGTSPHTPAAAGIH